MIPFHFYALIDGNCCTPELRELEQYKLETDWGHPKANIQEVKDKIGMQFIKIYQEIESVKQVVVISPIGGGAGTIVAVETLGNPYAKGLSFVHADLL